MIQEVAMDAADWHTLGLMSDPQGAGRGEFRPRQTRQLPRAVDLKGRLLSCQSY